MSKQKTKNVESTDSNDDCEEEYEEVYGENSDDETFEFIEAIINDSKTLNELATFLKKSKFYVRNILKDKEFTKKVDSRDPKYTEVFDGIAFIKGKLELNKKPQKNAVAKKEPVVEQPKKNIDEPKFKMNGTIPVQTENRQINFICRMK